MRNRFRARRLIIFSGFLFLCAIAWKGSCKGKDVFINEVCSSNLSVIKDSEKEYSDYIELYNAGDEAVSLNGWYLSDSEMDLKGCLTDIIIEAHGYCVIFADGSGEAEDSIPLKIAKTGEDLFLLNADEILVDQVYVPEMEADTVYARAADGADDWKTQEPSPGETNNHSETIPNRILAAPELSASSGFYDEAFSLELRAGYGNKIYYTTDGSEPTCDSTLYEGGIRIENVSGSPNVYNAVKNVVPDWKNYEPSAEPVDKAVVIRAIAMDAAGNVSDVTTGIYFVGEPEYRDVDVLSIVAEPDDLFGKDGIYVTGSAYDEWYLNGEEGEEPEPNFMGTGIRSERTCNIQFFEEGTEVLNQKAGIRIKGSGTRRSAKKKLKLYARSQYNGNDVFEWNPFIDHSTHAFTLEEEFASSFTQSLLTDRAVATQFSRPVTVFINGEYWYSGYMLERYSRRYFQEIYGVSKDNVLIIRDTFVASGENNDRNRYLDMVEFAQQHDMSETENYEQFGQMIDIQSFIDYMAANIYLCNMDANEGHNYILWRTYEDDGTEYGDTRWRWAMYDLDAVEWTDTAFYGVEHWAEIDSFSSVMEYSEIPYDQNEIYKALKSNPEFCRRFVLSFLDMANVNFAPETVKPKLEAYGYGLDWNDSFFLRRFDSITADLAEEFGLQGTLEEVTVSVNDPQGGYVRVNTTVPDLSEGAWTGKYYTDYDLSLEAVAGEGYAFAGWEGDYEGCEENISLSMEEGGLAVKAVFEKLK